LHPVEALLHAAKLVDDAAAMRAHGPISVPPIDAGRLRECKSSVVAKLAGGLTRSRATQGRR
jgi:dihydrolipoamide dehydrogenase